MKNLLYFLLLIYCFSPVFSQINPGEKFIFVPHPRSNNAEVQSVLPAIEKINFSLYNVIMLGGDLTWYSSINRKSLNYLDSLFDLESPNTLWTMGNHDLDHTDLIREYTGRPLYYAYYHNNITFLVLNAEQNASGFSSTFISGDQLSMVENVCDTIQDSDFLVVIHGRLMWMIGNSDFATRLDSVAESTKQLDTTNFYQVVYPEFQKVKKKGIPVVCIGGDKSKININYKAEDSISFLTSSMAPEFPDSLNYVIILDYNKPGKTLTWNFIRLDKVEKNPEEPISVGDKSLNENDIEFCQIPGSLEIQIRLNAAYNRPEDICIFSVTGQKLNEFRMIPGEVRSEKIERSGLYVIRGISGNNIFTGKVIIR
jgi:hypothetical protein